MIGRLVRSDGTIYEFDFDRVVAEVYCDVGKECVMGRYEETTQEDTGELVHVYKEEKE